MEETSEGKVSEYSDIGSEKKSLKLKNIVIEDYENIDPYDFKVNHRPLLGSEVAGIKSDYLCLNRDIVVIWSSKDHKFRIVDGKQHFHAMKLLIKEGKISPVKRYPCNILIRNSTGNRLDYENIEDRRLANSISFTENINQRRACVIDLVVKLWNLGNYYIKTTGKTHGMYEYIMQHGHLGRGYSKETLKKYFGYGNKLYECGLLEQAMAQKNRSRFDTDTKIREEIAKASKNVVKKKEYSLTIRVSGTAYGYLKQFKNNSKFWDIAVEDMKKGH